MTTNALVPFIPQGVAVNHLPQLYAVGRQELSCRDEPCSLITDNTGSADHKKDLLFYGKHARFLQRTLKSTYVLSSVDWNSRGSRQEPSFIKSNMRFKGTYGMEGSFLGNVTEKGIYIDFFS